MPATTRGSTRCETDERPIYGEATLDEAQDLIERFNWPGNVRQLENTIFRAVVLCDGDALDACDFPQIAAVLGVICGSLGKFPLDVTLLAQTEVAEVAEGGGEGRGG